MSEHQKFKPLCTLDVYFRLDEQSIVKIPSHMNFRSIMRLSGLKGPNGMRSLR